MVGVAPSTVPRVRVVARSADVRARLARAVERAGVDSRRERVDVVVVPGADAHTLPPLPDAAGVLVVGGDVRQVTAALASSTRAWGLVDEEASPDTLSAAIRAVAAGFRVLPTTVAPIRLPPDAGSEDESGSAVEEPLTPREHEVLELAAQGLSNHAIGARLGISDHTVKFHLASIYGKLGVRSRTAAVRRGLTRGLITI